MQLSRILSTPCCEIILPPILLALVSIEAKSWCIEKDCLQDQSIRVVNRTTGECISCFPCLDCQDGLPSVPCGATVTDDTPIDCDGHLRPDPSQVSTAGSYATNGILTSLATSLVTWRHPSFLQTSLVTVALFTSSIPSEIIHPSSSTNFAHLQSSTVHSGFLGIPEKTRNKRESPFDESPKTGSYTSIYVFGCIFLVILALITWLYRRNTHLYHHVHSNPIVPISHEPNLVISTDQESKECALYPDISVATFSCSSQPTEDQVSQEENDSQNFQSDEALIDSREEIPLSLEFNMEVFQPHDQLVPNHLDVWNAQPSDLGSVRPVKWQAIPQTEKYSTKLLQVPIPLFQKICLSLDVERTDGKDVSLLAHKLGLSVENFELLHQAAQNRGTSRTYILLKEKFNGTVGDFVGKMNDMERDDIICLINEWNG